MPRDREPRHVPLMPPRKLQRRIELGLLMHSHARKVATEWWTDPQAWGLVMYSPVGNGKSQAMAELYEAAYAARPSPSHRVLWLRARLLEQLDWIDRAAVIARCKAAWMLLIDELPTAAEIERGRVKRDTVATLGDIFEDRGDAGRCTVATSNSSRADFGSLWGDRLISRLREGGLDAGRVRWLVEIQGDDLRGVVEPLPEEQPEELPPENLERLAYYTERFTATIEAAEAKEREKARARRHDADDQARRDRQADEAIRETNRRRAWGSLALDELARAALADDPAALDLLDRIAARARGRREHQREDERHERQRARARASRRGSLPSPKGPGG